MNDALVEKVAHYLAECDGNFYWKHSFPEDQRPRAEEWYIANAKKYIGIVNIVLEHKKNE